LLNDEMQAHLQDVGEVAYLRECRSLAVQAIRDDPVRFARLCLLRAVDYWLGTVYTHRRPGHGGWPLNAQRALGTVMALLELALLLGALVVRRRLDVPLRWLGAIALLMSVTYFATHVQIRFRAPSEPILALVIAAAIVGRQPNAAAPSS
jgi:hypothetical protein